MYYLREVNYIQLISYLVLSAFWIVGGWLIISKTFRLRAPERLIGGIASGFLLFIVLSNLLSSILPLTIAFWMAGAGILALGVIMSSLKLGEGKLDFSDWRQVGLLAALLCLLLFFQVIQRGLALFDEYLHLPLISVMATGDIPPHFYLDPSKSFAYHYGLQVWSASLVRLASFFPWSAFDLSCAFVLSLTACLGYVWFAQKIRSEVAALISTALIMLGGGTRWLLLLLPGTILDRIDKSVELINTGADTASSLVLALTRPWVLEGGGAMSIPFAFHSGIFVPVVFVLGSTGAMPFLTILLLLMLGQGIRQDVFSCVVVAVVFASLALSAEHLFVFIWLALALLVMLLAINSARRTKAVEKGHILFWVGILLISGVLAAVQGGFLTEVLRSTSKSFLGLDVGVNYNYHGFELRWPPALPSAHFADLSLLKLPQLIVMLAEMGPALIFMIFAAYDAWKQYQKGRFLRAGISVSATLGLFFVLIVQYGVDRSSTRIPATSLWIWLLLGLPYVWIIYNQARPVVRSILAMAMGILALGGAVILSIQLTTIPMAQYSYYIDEVDTHMSARFWDKLPEDAQVLDHIAYRGVTVFGRPSRSFSGIYNSLPEYRALVENPNVGSVIKAGYGYVYMDGEWWARMDNEVKKSYFSPCVEVLKDLSFNNVTFRRLYDVSACSGSDL